MKNSARILIALSSIFILTPVSLAEFSVVPAPPHERQFNFEISPGQSREAGIIVNNLGGRAITVSTYSADGTNSSQGTFALTSRSYEQKHIGTWVTFAEPSVTIPPRQQMTIPFIVKVPENATPGNYGGGIAVEASSADLKGEDGLEEAGAVTTAARIYVRMFVSVPGEKIEDYEWTDFGFNGKTDSYKSSFFFSFKNNGNTIIIAEPRVELFGFPPLKESTLTLPNITIQPGTALEKIQLRWDDQPPFGYYVATGTVDFSEFDIVNNEKTNPQTLQRKLNINLTPPYIVAIILGAAIALIAYAVYAPWSRRRLIAGCKKYKVKSGDTLDSIADDAGTGWKTIVKINKLKRPYTIKPGQTLLIPPKK